LDVQFTEDLANGLGLTLLVQQTGSLDLAINERDAIAVTAFVPARIAWASVLACSGSNDGWSSTFEGLFSGLFQSEDEDASGACVEGQSPLGGSINLDPLREDSEEDAAEVPFALENLKGGELTMSSDYGSLDLLDLSFETATVATHYGDIAGSINAATLGAATQYGDLDLVGVFDTVEASTQYGDVRLDVLGGNSGEYAAASQYGDVAVNVLYGADRGYDASAATEYGEAIIELTGVEEAKEKDVDTKSTALRGEDFPIPLPFGPEDEAREEAPEHGAEEAVTEDFDLKAIQVKVSAASNYGDVLITDVGLPELDDEDEN
jgi:hypothetical protein